MKNVVLQTLLVLITSTFTFAQIDSSSLVYDPALNSDILYMSEKIDEIKSVDNESITQISQIDASKIKSNSVTYTPEMMEAVLGEGMGFIATTENLAPIQTLAETPLPAISTYTDSIIVNYNYAKKYFNASMYFDVEVPFYYSYFYSVYSYIKDKDNSERDKEAYYWEMDQYLKGRYVNRNNFKK